MSRPRSLRGSSSFEPPKAMQKILDTLYLYKEKDRLLSRLFQELPDKKTYADYYVVIEKPIALDIIQARLKSGEYTDFDDFIKDVAQLFHNAKFYNDRHSQVYSDACTLEGLLQDELNQLKERGLIESSEIPNLGPLPGSSPVSVQSKADAEESSEEESGSEDEEDEEDDDGAVDVDDEDEYNEKEAKAQPATRAGLRTRSSRRSMTKADSGSPSAGDKKDASVKSSEDTPKPETEAPKKRKRGRPPKIDTPEEARIRTILRAVRKVKDKDGRQLFLEFEKLPDPQLYPDYYKEIKRPIALDHITRKIKRRDYKKMDNFVADMNLMFNNAQEYNADGSQIFKDAVTLQKTLQKVAEEERNKDDSEYINRGLAKDPKINESGAGETSAGKMQRIPVGSVEVNGERYEIGDWVMLSNPNDAEKPIVAQIFKTWQTPTGEEWINVCWYYRPEQTVHKHSRTFYENEVFKSGQYRDHPASQILSKTFVQFITRYTRGRPKHWPSDQKIWVVESRYNDLSKTFSKINQWRACVPEEVRFDEYDIYPFERLRHYEKFPSPLLALLPADAQVIAGGDKLPDPIKQGSDEAPPTTGAIYRSDSPEPEKEPTPPPPPPQPVEQRVKESFMINTPSNLPQPMPYTKPLGTPTPQQYRPVPPPTRYNVPNRQQPPPPPTPPIEAPSAFTMPIAVPPEVSNLVAKDNQGRVLWFGVPPLDIVGWSGNGEVTGHSLEYLAKKRKKAAENEEKMQDIVLSEQPEDRGLKRRATEILVKALGLIGKN